MKDKKTLLDEIKKQCGDCEAWSGTDCIRNPYAQGCLKDEKQVIECHGMLKGCDMVQQAVKDTAKEIFEKMLFEFRHYGKNEKLTKPQVLGTLEKIVKSKGVEVE